MNYIEPINFCTAKRTIKKIQRQPMGWEKYLQIIYIKKVISKMYEKMSTPQ